MGNSGRDANRISWGVGKEWKASPSIALRGKTSPFLRAEDTMPGPEGLTRLCPAQNGDTCSSPFFFLPMDLVIPLGELTQ